VSIESDRQHPSSLAPRGKSKPGASVGTGRLERHPVDLVGPLAFKLHSAGWAELGREWDWERYYLDRCEVNRIWRIESGRITVWSGTDQTVLSAGETWFLPAGLPLRCACLSVSKFWVDFNAFAYVNEEILGFYRGKKPMRLRSMKWPDLKRDARHLLASASALGQAAFGAVNAYLETHDQDLDAERVAVFGKHQALIATIHQHLSIGLSIRELSAKSGMSDYYLSSLFKADMGMSIKKFVEHAVFKESARRLLKPEATVKAVAHGLGFQRESHFSRFFKKYGGVSPMFYRRKYSG